MISKVFQVVVIIFCCFWLTKEILLPGYVYFIYIDEYKELVTECARAMDTHWDVESSELNYLDGMEDFDGNDLVKDRKIQDGVDTRSYKVSFDKIQETLPGFKCKWTVESGIKNLLDELKKIDISKDIFNKREFYRLQQIEFLHQKHQIDDNLFWLK